MSEAQPHIIIFPAKPADLIKLVIVAAEFKQRVAAEHRHRVNVRILDENLRVPIEIRKETLAVRRRAAESAKEAVGRRVIPRTRDNIEQLLETFCEDKVVGVH